LKCKTLKSGDESSRRITTEKTVPIIPAKEPKIIYKVPISLWLVEASHLVAQLDTFFK